MEAPACIRDPALIGDPASIKTLLTCHTRVINFSIYSVHNCSCRRPYVCQYFLFHRNTGYDVFCIIRWHPASIGYPACIRDPAYIGDRASIKTSDLDPRLVLEIRLLFETRLLLEVLRYVKVKSKDIAAILIHSIYCDFFVDCILTFLYI